MKKEFLKKLRKYGFFIWLTSIIAFLIETISFNKTAHNDSYSSLQTLMFLITVVIGVISFISFSGLTFIFMVSSFFRRFDKRSVLITSLLLFTLGGVIIYMIRTAPSRTLQTNQQQVCNRTNPYTVPPEFERATSLIMERYIQHGEPNANEYQQMLNCIDIQFSDIHRAEKDTEGYFTFDTANSSLDKQVIYVDASFIDYDDLTTAFLLSHELTHARQFVDKILYHKTLSCVDQEVEAFKQQVVFYSYLNPEEQRSLSARATQGDKNNPELSQLQYLNNMSWNASVAVNGGQNRAFSQEEEQQYSALFEAKIRKMVVSIPSYQKECNL